MDACAPLLTPSQRSAASPAACSPSRTHVANWKKMQPSTIDGGHSLVELMITVILVMILAAFAIPNMATAIATLRLRGTASDFGGAVPLARTTASRKNVAYTILFNPTSVNGAYVDLSGNGSFDSGEPMIQFGGNANQVA